MADRPHRFTECVPVLLETAFGMVVMGVDEASLLERVARLAPDSNFKLDNG